MMPLECVPERVSVAPAGTVLRTAYSGTAFSSGSAVASAVGAAEASAVSSGSTVASRASPFSVTTTVGRSICDSSSAGAAATQPVSSSAKAKKRGKIRFIHTSFLGCGVKTACRS